MPQRGQISYEVAPSSHGRKNNGNPHARRGWPSEVALSGPWLVLDYRLEAVDQIASAVARSPAETYISKWATALLTRAPSTSPHRGQSDTLAGISCQQFLQCASFMHINSSSVPSWCCQRRDIPRRNGTTHGNLAAPSVTTASATVAANEKGARSSFGRNRAGPPSKTAVA